MAFKRDREIHTLVFCIMRLCHRIFRAGNTARGNVQSGSHSEGTVFVVAKVLAVQSRSCDRSYVCNLKYLIFPVLNERNTIDAQIHREF